MIKKLTFLIIAILILTSCMQPFDNPNDPANMGNNIIEEDIDELDPVARSFGGANDDRVRSLCIDNNGDILLAGEFISPGVDFNPEEEVDYHENGGGPERDIFISKYYADGTYGWTRTVGNRGADFAYGITSDSNGNVYVAGGFSELNVDFDRPNEDYKSSVNNIDIFIARYKSDGTHDWTKSIAGFNGSDYANDIECDSSDNIYVAGQIHGGSSIIDFNWNLYKDDFYTIPGSSFWAFLSKITPAGDYQWSRCFGNNDYSTRIEAIEIDAQGNIYLAGEFGGTVNFNANVPDSVGGNTSADNHSSNALNCEDVFITKLNSDGSYGWTKTFGGTMDETLEDISVDTEGNIFLTGIFYSSSVDFNPGPETDIRSLVSGKYMGHDAYYMKLNSDGSYGWAVTLGSDDGYFKGKTISTGPSGDVFIAGSFNEFDFDFDFTSGTDNKSTNGDKDIFISKINKSGAYLWTRILGKNSDDIPGLLKIGPDGSLYLAGEFSGQGVNMNPQFESAQLLNSNGEADAFFLFLPPQ